jgi:hypothetical protein
MGLMMIVHSYANAGFLGYTWRSVMISRIHCRICDRLHCCQPPASAALTLQQAVPLSGPLAAHLRQGLHNPVVLLRVWGPDWGANGCSFQCVELVAATCTCHVLS